MNGILNPGRYGRMSRFCCSRCILSSALGVADLDSSANDFPGLALGIRHAKAAADDRAESSRGTRFGAKCLRPVRHDLLRRRFGRVAGDRRTHAGLKSSMPCSPTIAPPSFVSPVGSGAARSAPPTAISPTPPAACSAPSGRSYQRCSGGFGSVDECAGSG